MTLPSSATPPVSVVILTFNAEASIERTLAAAARVSDDIHVLDSFSADGTLEICARYGAGISQRAFANYSDQRNWAIDNLELRYPWQLHVDADEEMTPELVDRILAIDFAATPFDGFIIGRKLVFLGRVLRFGGIARTWHYRLFRTGFGRCENRLYDQHFTASGRVGTIEAFMLDHQEASLSTWTIAHNRWSDMEATEMLSDESGKPGQVAERLAGTRIERKRYLKSRYYRLPIFLRSLSYFIYRYFLRLGFLDGVPGLIYHVLQGFWFRFLVDAKIYEKRAGGTGQPNRP